jgi:glucose 1-dehydrogenase
MSLEGKVAIVTGGNSGIGKAIALALAAEGANIVIDYVANADQATEDLERQIVALGNRALGVEADVSKVADLQKLIDGALRWFGRVDIMVNNAGVETRTGILDTTEEQYEKVLDINLKSAFFGTQLAAKQMIAQGGGGRILNISSVRANLGINAGYSAYVAAKGAISSLTRQWATEWARYGIHVNAIMPTFVDTPQIASLLADPAFRAGIVSRIPLGRVGETRDLVGPAIFLCSDAASFVTGQVLGIDGGLTATQ